MSEIPKVEVTLANWNHTVINGLRTSELKVEEGSQFAVMATADGGEVLVNGDRVLTYRWNGTREQMMFDISQGGARYLNRSHQELVDRINFQAKAAI